MTPSRTRSSGPPAAGATTGSPLAAASCNVWPNVSCGPAVHEHVKAGVDPGQVLAAALAEEQRGRHRPPDRRLGRAAADDDQPDARQRRDLSQQVEPLLRGQPPDVADDQLAAGRHLGPQPAAALGRIEPARSPRRGPTPAPARCRARAGQPRSRCTAPGSGRRHCGSCAGAASRSPARPRRRGRCARRRAGRSRTPRRWATAGRARPRSRQRRARTARPGGPGQRDGAATASRTAEPGSPTRKPG